MSKKMHVKKPQDATLRNVRAAVKRQVALARRMTDQIADATVLEARVSRLETRLDVLVAYLKEKRI